MAFEATKLPHETAGAPTRKVLAFVFGFVFFVIALIAVLHFYYRARVAPGALVEQLQTFPAPRLQPNPSQDYETFRKAQVEELMGIRWVDRRQNLIHVPIERAMAYIVSRGASAYDSLDDASRAAAADEAKAKRADHPPSAAAAPYGAQQ